MTPPNTIRNTGRFFAFLSLLACLGLVSAGYWAYTRHQWLPTAKVVTGTVTGQVLHVSEGGRQTLAPEIRYAMNGQSYDFRSPLSSTGIRFQNVEQVQLYVDADHPEKALIKGAWWETWLGPIATAAISLILLLCFAPMAKVCFRLAS